MERKVGPGKVNCSMIKGRVVHRSVLNWFVNNTISDMYLDTVDTSGTMVISGFFLCQLLSPLLEVVVVVPRCRKRQAGARLNVGVKNGIRRTLGGG